MKQYETTRVAIQHWLERGQDISKYLELYGTPDIKTDLLNYHPGSKFGVFRPILRTFNISFDHVSRDSQGLLYIIASLNVGQVSDEFLQRSFQHHPTGNWPETDGKADFHRRIPLGENLFSILSSIQRQEVAIDELVKIALLRRQESGLTLHTVS